MNFYKMDIKIIAKTEIGTLALKRHVKESKLLGLRDKTVMRGIGKQTVENEEPYTINLKLHVFVTNPHFIQGTLYEIKKALLINGASFEVDYTIEVKE